MRTPRPLTQTLVATLIGLLAFGPLGATRARADVTVSVDLPYQGALDQEHNAFTMRDRIADSLYALRTTTVEDLLHSRKAIQVLLSTSARAKANFEVPSSVVSLYLIGSTARNEPRGTSKSARPVHGVGSANLPELSAAIHAFDRGAEVPRFDPALRRQLISGLAHVTAQLARFDQAIQFIETDFWNDPKVDRQFFDQFIDRPWTDATRGGHIPDFASFAAQLKKLWLQDHGAADDLRLFRAQREMLLDRYHLLGIEQDGQPTYLRVYRAMQDQGFPDAKMVQKPVKSELPQGKDPIPPPVAFDRAMDEALDTLSGKAGETKIKALSTALGALVDESLLLSLAENTDRLTELTKEASYDGNRSSPLLELARCPELWDTTMAKYGYLGDLIDFAGAREEFEAYFTRVDKVKRRVRYTTYSVGIGIGIVAMAASGGALGAGAIAGIGMKSLAVGAGLASSGVLASQATYDYADSSAAARAARGLYLGTAHAGSHQRMKDAVLLAEENYRNLVICLVTLGLQPSVLAQIAKGRFIFATGTERLVAMSKSELDLLGRTLKPVLARASVLAPMGRAVISLARSIMGVATDGAALISFEQALPAMAAQLKIAPTLLRMQIEATPMVGALFRGYANMIAAKPAFWSILARELRANALTGVVAEVIVRGDQITEQKGAVAFDIASTSLIVGTLVVIAAKGGVRLGFKDVRRPTTIFDPGYTAKERVVRFIDVGVPYAAVGFFSTAAVRTGQEIGRCRKPGVDCDFGESAWRVGQYSLIQGGLAAVSSNLRFANGQTWLDNNLKNWITDPKKNRIILSDVSMANNTLGAWTSISINKLVGLDDAVAGASADQSTDPDAEPLRTIELEEPVQAYVKIDSGDQAEAAHLFDFLRDGK